jgi:hypothetical protein
MSMRKMVSFATVSLLALVFLVSTALAQGQAPSQSSTEVPKAQVQAPGQSGGVATTDGAALTVKGKIAYLKQLGGYYIKGEEPRHEFIIVNQNPKVLDKLMKSGETATFETRRAKGAEFLSIEKINGKKYTGTQKSAPK